MDHDACKLQAKRALDVTSMSVSGSGRERRSVLMAEDRIEQHLKRTYGTGLNGQYNVILVVFSCLKVMRESFWLVL